MNRRDFVTAAFSRMAIGSAALRTAGAIGKPGTRQ